MSLSSLGPARLGTCDSPPGVKWLGNGVLFSVPCGPNTEVKKACSSNVSVHTCWWYSVSHWDGFASLTFSRRNNFF